MISVQSAISRARWSLTFGSLLKGLLIGGAGACLLVGPMLGRQTAVTGALMVIAGVWLVLSYQSVKGSRLAAGSPSLIAAGQFEQAERHIEDALRSFSLFRTVKLLSLHHLAVLRHAQRRWAEAAELCRALLRQRLGGLDHLSRPSRLLLADSLLELGDLRGAHEAISGLYDQRLPLAEGLNLLAVQLDYLARIGAWETMLQGVMEKVQMAELMPTPAAARAQAYLALAAARSDRKPLAEWLRRRAELLMEPVRLISERPLLAELWPGTPFERTA